MGRVMKKSKKIILLSSTLLMMMACQGGGNNPSPSDNVPSSVPVSVEKKESKWGAEYTDLIIGTLGEDIPYIESSSFQIEKTKDGFGDDMIIFYVFFDGANLEEKLTEYSLIAELDGDYKVTNKVEKGYDESGNYYEYEVYYADKDISDSKGIEMQFLLGGKDGVDCLGIFAYNYIVDNPNYWPTNLVTSLLGYDIPHLEDTGEYTYTAKINADGTYNYIDMVIAGVPATAENDYMTLLEEAGYSVGAPTYDEETGDYYGRYATSPKKDHIIQFGYSSYGLEIYIYKV